MFFQSPWGVLTTFRSFQFVYLLSNGRKIRTRTPSIYALNINRHSSLASERQKLNAFKSTTRIYIINIECLIPNLTPKRSWIFLASVHAKTPTERVLHLLFHRAPVAIRAGRAGLQRRHKYQSMGNTEPPPCFMLHFISCFGLFCLTCFAKGVARQLELQKRSHSSQWIACCHHASVCSLVASSTQLAGQCKKTKEKNTGPRVIRIKCPGGVSWVLVQTIVRQSMSKQCNLEVKKSSWSWVEIMHHELSVVSLSGLSQDLAPDLRCNMASVVASWQNGSEQCTEGVRISTNNSSNNNNNSNSNNNNNNNNNFRDNNNHHHHHHVH